MNSPSEITQCPATDCSLYPFRLGETIKGTSKQKAIRRKCEDCLQTKFTGKCKEKSCQLFGYREGHRPQVESSEDGNPIKKKVLSVEHLEKMKAGRSKNPIIPSKTLTEKPIIRIKRRIQVKV